MKKIISFLFLSFIVGYVSAKSVDELTERKTAEYFYQLNTQGNFKSAIVLTLAYKCTSQQSGTLKSGNTSVYYYVFNDGNRGFIIVSGDDASRPILGYSTEKGFDAANVPANVAKWMNGYKIYYAN